MSWSFDYTICHLSNFYTEMSLLKSFPPRQSRLKYPSKLTSAATLSPALIPSLLPVSEWEPPGIEEDDVTTFADHKDAETSKDIRVMDAASPQKPSGRTSPIPEEPSDGAASPSPKEDSDTSSPSSKGTASSSSSKDDGKAIEEKEEREGPEADPLLAPESPERGEEAL